MDEVKFCCDCRKPYKTPPQAPKARRCRDCYARTLRAVGEPRRCQCGTVVTVAPDAGVPVESHFKCRKCRTGGEKAKAVTYNMLAATKEDA